MKSITFAVSKGGVGKSLLTANVGASLAHNGYKTALVEGDPNRPLQLIFNLGLPEKATRLNDIVERDLDVKESIYSTSIQNLFIIPSGIPLEAYFDIDPIAFARKLMEIGCDYLFIDVPFPMGEAAFLSLGVCQYFVPVIIEEAFALSVESAIDTVRLGKYYLKSVPLGFVLNRITSAERFNDEFVRDLENLLELPCLAKIKDYPDVSRSYGGAKVTRAFLAYHEFPASGSLAASEFSRTIDELTQKIVSLTEVNKPEKKNIVEFLSTKIIPIRR